MPSHAVKGRPSGLLPDTQGRRHGEGHALWVGKRRQLNEPCPIWMPLEQTLRKLERQTRLAAPSDPREGEEAGLSQERPPIRKIPFPTPKTRSLLPGLLRRRLGCRPRLPATRAH